MVAEERGQRLRVRRRCRVHVVARVQRVQPGRRGSLGVVRGRRLEREVEDGVHVAVAQVGRQLGRVGVVDLAEHEEVGVADGGRVGTHRRRELLPELEVDVLGGVDAEAVHAQVDPLVVDVDEPVHDLRVLGHQVVEAREVAVRRRLPRVGRVSAVVVERRVVQPVRDLDVRVLGLDHRGVREARRRVHRRERVRAGVRVRVEGVAVRVLVRARGLVDVAVRLLRVVDDVGGVVGDDVEVHLDAARVGVGDEGLELGVGAQVRVDLREVGDPVAVVPGRRVGARALHRLVLERRRQPDRGAAEALDVVELAVQAGQVAALVEALVGRVEAGGQTVAREPAGVVRRVAVGEPVRHDEVELLVRAGVAHRVRDDRVVGGRVARGQPERGQRGAVRGVVVGEADGRGSGQDERGVAAAAVAAVGLVPGVVERDLVRVRARGQREVGGVPAGHVGRRQLRLRAVRLPVARAAELALQVPDERSGPVRSHGRGRDDGRCDEADEGDGEGRQSGDRATPARCASGGCGRHGDSFVFPRTSLCAGCAG